jgi:hypothetical protein
VSSGSALRESWPYKCEVMDPRVQTANEDGQVIEIATPQTRLSCNLHCNWKYY